MPTKVKKPARARTPRTVGEPVIVAAQGPPCTTEERLQHIAAIGQRIGDHVQFICQAGNLSGTSAEAKEKAILAFHERMVVLERQLGRIEEDLRLG